jgi:hypothetical protein
MGVAGHDDVVRRESLVHGRGMYGPGRGLSRFHVKHSNHVQPGPRDRSAELISHPRDRTELAGIEVARPADRRWRNPSAADQGQSGQGSAQ